MSKPAYIPNFVKGAWSDGIAFMWEQMPWEQRTDARRECFFNTKNTEYTYGEGRGERTYVPRPLQDAPSLVLAAWSLVHNRYGFGFEACFINGYENERKHLGWHADDSPLIDHTKPIVVVSFGAEREIWTRHLAGHPTGSDNVERFLLGDCSLFEMPAGFQYTHQHRIPKHSAKCGPRISLTFRALKE